VVIWLERGADLHTAQLWLAVLPSVWLSAQFSAWLSVWLSAWLPVWLAVWMTQSVTCAAGYVVWRRQQAHCSCGRRWSVVVSKRSRTIHEYTPLAEPWWDLDVGGDLRACSYSVIAGTSTSSLDSVESKVFTARRFWHWKVLTGNTLFLLWESCKDNFFYGCSQCFVYGLVSSKILNPLTLSLESRIVLEWVMVCVTFLFFFQAMFA